MRKTIICGSILIILLTACIGKSQSGIINTQKTPTNQSISDSISSPLIPTLPSPTIVVNEPISTLAPEVLPMRSKISSPFAGIDLDDLAGMISNPFHPPEDGSDDPHQGVDISDVDEESKMALTGRDVYALIEGEVIGIMQDRFPYGNAILIKTDIKSLPESWLTYLESLEVPNSWEKNSALTCPEGWNAPPDAQNNLALYILYAHMQDPIILELGQQIISGGKLGIVGMSGNALAPHLHIEIRFGFNVDSFGSMAHYDVSATPEEMFNYCRWRVSGWYRLIDPMILLAMN